MVFETEETSIESGRPVELYHFSVGATHYYYTSAPDSFLFGGNTWLPRQITRTSPTQSTEERRQQIEITIPTEDTVASRFVGIIPGQPMFLEVSRYHRGDTEVYLVWSGIIAGATYGKQGAECTLRGVNTESAFSRPIPKFKYQGLCNYVLFDLNCQLDADDYKFTGTVASISGSTITVTGISAQGTDWMVAGYVNFNDTDFRLVLSQSGDVLTMYLPFENNPAGQSVDCFAGCDHSIVDCGNKFIVDNPTDGNIINYGGFPFVPELNPFIVGMD